jgi:succinoglycan biosynthesis protein ExoA
MSDAPPVRLVSAIVPCRNERGHIEAFCEAVLAQRLPPGVLLEVLVADGRSDDGTRDWLVAFCADNQAPDRRFVLVDNPGRIVSTGLNAAIAQSQGDVIVRLDVHTVYAADYIEQCLQALDKSGADNVGGPWKAEGSGATQEAIAAVFQSRLVAGGARSRQLDYDGWVDTVYLGCWPRATFQRFGGFDEQLVRNQDDEHNLRIVRGGGRVWQSAAIRSTYRPRARIADVFRQWRQYGYWKPFVMKKHGQPGALRHLVPAIFVAALAGGSAFALAAGPWLAAWALLPLGGLLLLYAAYLGAATLDVSRGLPPSTADRAGVLLRVPAIVAVHHLGYGLGSWRGWWDAAVRGRADPAFGRLTR